MHLTVDEADLRAVLKNRRASFCTDSDFDEFIMQAEQMIRDCDSEQLAPALQQVFEIQKRRGSILTDAGFDEFVSNCEVFLGR